MFPSGHYKNQTDEELIKLYKQNGELEIVGEMEQGALGRISVRVVSGNLASTPAGVCLAERIAGLVASEELPRPIQDLLRFESWSWAPGRAPQMRDR